MSTSNKSSNKVCVGHTIIHTMYSVQYIGYRRVELQYWVALVDCSKPPIITLHQLIMDSYLEQYHDKKTKKKGYVYLSLALIFPRSGSSILHPGTDVYLTLNLAHR